MPKALLLFHLLLLSYLIRGQTSNCDQWLRLAHQADSIDEHERAIALYDSAATDPECRARAIGQRGYLKAGEMRLIKEGLKDLDTSLVLAPNAHSILLLRCEILARLQRFDEALADADLSLANAMTTSDTCNALIARGTVHYRSRHFTRSELDFERALDLDSLNEMALLGMSNVLRDLGHAEAALSILQRLETIRPNDPKYMTNTAYVLVELGRYDAAIKKYDAALALFPDRGAIWNNRGYARLKNGDTEGAFQDIRKSLELFADNSYAYRNLGLVEHARGNHETGCSAWKTAIALGFSARFGPEVEMLLDTMCK